MQPYHSRDIARIHHIDLGVASGCPRTPLVPTIHDLDLPHNTEIFLAVYHDLGTRHSSSRAPPRAGTAISRYDTHVVVVVSISIRRERASL